MRRAAAAGTLVAGLAAWITAGALTASPPSVRAQTQPPIEIGRTQRARFVPSSGSGRPIFILALGSDARPGERVDRRLADSIHLLAINPREGAATVLGFPRDSYVSIPGVGQRKINESLFYGGPELTVRTVEEVTGIHIDYYLLTSFPGIQAMVNDIGGVEVNVPYAMNDPASGAVFPAGPKVLTGKEALAFSRNRKDTPNGDFSRSENQGLLLISALGELQRDFRRDPVSLFTWIVAGIRNIQTDLSFPEIFNLAVTALTVDPGRVRNLVVPGGLGFAGEASIVMIQDSAQAIYRDMADDGIVG